MSTRDELTQAYKLIKAGEKSQAHIILNCVINEGYKLAKNDLADAWYLMANAETSQDQQRLALQKTLRLQPDHQEAKQQLARLGSGPLASTPTSVVQPPAIKAPPEPVTSTVANPSPPGFLPIRLAYLVLRLLKEMLGYKHVSTADEKRQSAWDLERSMDKYNIENGQEEMNRILEENEYWRRLIE